MLAPLIVTSLQGRAEEEGRRRLIGPVNPSVCISISSPFHQAPDGTALGCSLTFRWCCCFPFPWWQSNCQSSAQDNVGVRQGTYRMSLFILFRPIYWFIVNHIFCVLLLSMAVSSITLYILPLAFMLNRTSFVSSFYLLIVQITAFHASSTCLTIFWIYMSFSSLLGNWWLCNWLDDL